MKVESQGLISLRFDKLAAITGGTLYNTAGAARAFKGVSLDSRSVDRGQLFVAIKGDNNDGHDYINGAITRGASGVLAERDFSRLEHIRGDVPVVAVPNSHTAMMALAANYRDWLPTRFVGITGSNGKTTTKELAYQLISAAESASYRSPGNLNNLFGVPLSLFGISEETRFAVMEMGISTNMEMPRLATMVRPDVVCLTNVGASHLENLGTVENVAKAKLELVRRSSPETAVIVNADDPVLMAETSKLRSDFTTFGMEATDCDVRPDSVELLEDGSSLVAIQGYRFRLPLSGRFQVMNLLAAYAIFKALGLSFDGIDTESIDLTTAPMRGQIVHKGDIEFVVDCYNANPASMRVAIETFFERPTNQRRVIVLGDMLELGADATTYHEGIGRALSQQRFDLAVFVGPLSAHMMAAAIGEGAFTDRMTHFERISDARRAISELLRPGDRVLLKASRGIGLEVLLEEFDEGDA